MIPFPFYEPDASPFNGNSSDHIRNALPVRDGWGPCPSLQTQATALPSTPLGGIGIIRPGGTYQTFAGTTTKLYQLASGGTSWTDVSGGLTFNVPDGDYWSFLDFGATLLATNQNDGLHELDSGTFVAVSGAPPAGKTAFNIGEYVFVGNTVDEPLGLYNSGIGNRTQWIPGKELAGVQIFPDGGEIMAGVSGEQGGTVLQRNAIREIVLQTGGQYAYTVPRVNNTRGCVAPASVVQAANTFFYLDEDGFYEGFAGNPIGAEKVNRTFFEEVDQEELHRVQGASDPFNKLVWWRYPLVGGAYAILVFDWQLQQWSRIDANVGFIFGATSAGYAFDDLDGLSATLDGLPYPFDSRAYKGGLPLFAGFDADHGFGYFSGPPYAATFRSAQVPLGGEAERAFVNGFRIKTDARNTESADVTARAGTMATHDDDVAWSGSLSRVPSTGMVPCRADGRFHRFEVTIPQGASWTHCHGVTPQTKQAGRR